MQGFNMGKYVPPDQEGVVSGNALHKKRPPGMSGGGGGGTQTVRFEMPFAVWCGSCPRPTVIGQGTRFNAAKTRVGRYHSSPVFAFRMRHAACGGEIEIRTDPANTAYVVVEGARKRDLGPDEESLVKSRDGLVGGEIATEGERRDAREVAFRNLEKTIEDRAAAERGVERIEELEEKGRVWEDPYERNRRLRRDFRAGRKGREREARRGEEIKGRLGLGEEFELVAEVEEDGIRAGLVDFGGEPDGGEKRVDQALAKPLFGGSARTAGGSGETKKDGKDKKKSKPKKQLKSEMAATRMRENLVSEIVGNTRAARDPFLDFGAKASPRSPVPLLPGLKRKRVAETGPGPPVEGEKEMEDAAPTPASTVTGLVNYDSD